MVTPISETLRPVSRATSLAVASAEWRPWLAPMPTIDPMVVMRSARALDDYGPEFRYGHYLVTGGLGKLIGGAAGVGGLVLAAQIVVFMILAALILWVITEV